LRVNAFTPAKISFVQQATQKRKGRTLGNGHRLRPVASCSRRSAPLESVVSEYLEKVYLHAQTTKSL
jgi:hypothetical protein